MIKVDFTNALDPKVLTSYQEEVNKYHVNLTTKTGLGSDFLGWTTWPFDYDKTEFELVKKVAKDVRAKADTLFSFGNKPLTISMAAREPK
jgi:glucose-6-phosphate isomerase